MCAAATLLLTGHRHVPDAKRSGVYRGWAERVSTSMMTRYSCALDDKDMAANKAIDTALDAG